MVFASKEGKKMELVKKERWYEREGEEKGEIGYLLFGG